MKRTLKKGLEALGQKSLSDDVLMKEIVFVDELLRWNKKINLTAITAPEEVIEKHLIDSLMLVSKLNDRNKILDVGSGAGIPVIPLAIAMPDKHFLSVDSIGKKVNFQKHIIRQLGLKNLEVSCCRVEDIIDNSSCWSGVDVVIARAVGSLDFLLTISKTLLRPGGVLLAMKGPEGEKELQDLDTQGHKYFKLPPQADCYELPFSRAQRCLIEAVRLSDSEVG